MHFQHLGDSVAYFDNYNDFPKNVVVSSRSELLDDFQGYGFSSVEVFEGVNFYNHSNEYYIRCVK